jgi:FeS assembly SUF system regulator
MLKVSKLTDYGIGLMTSLARRESPDPVTARELSEVMGLPLPTVSKLLKVLSGQGLLLSTRGASGGYALARTPEQITLVDMVEALDGPMALTECSGSAACACELEVACGLKANWNWINQQLLGTLRGITLQNMVGSVARDLRALDDPRLRDNRNNLVNNKVAF